MNEFEDLIEYEDVLPDPALEQTEEAPEDSIINDNDDSDEDYTPYYEVLKEVGYIRTPEDFEFDGKEESLKSALDISKNAFKEEVKQEMWNSLPPDFQALLDYGLKGGTSLEDYMAAYNPIDYDSLDLDDDQTQRAIIREYRRATFNHDDQRIDAFLAKLESKDPELLKEEAFDSLEELKKLQAISKQKLISDLEARQEQQRIESEKQVTQLNTVIDSLEEEDSRKARLKAFMLSPVRIDNRVTTQLDHALMSIFSNPDHLVQLANLLADYNPKKGLSTERLESKIKTKNNTTFKQLLDSSVNNSTKKSSKNISKDNFDWEYWAGTY